jgi:hypothetical protein
MGIGADVRKACSTKSAPDRPVEHRLPPQLASPSSVLAAPRLSASGDGR